MNRRTQHWQNVKVWVYTFRFWWSSSSFDNEKSNIYPYQPYRRTHQLDAVYHPSSHQGLWWLDKPQNAKKKHSCYFFALLVMTFIIECKQFSVFKHFTLHFFRLIFILMPFDSNIVVGWIDWLAGAGRHQHSALHAIFNKKWQYRWKKNTHTHSRLTHHNSIMSIVLNCIG